MSLSEGGDKRQKILRAAVRVFSQKGFHETKVDEIAQLADVGKGTVYEYFSSKAELFQEMFKEGFKLYGESVAQELKPGMNCREKLNRLAKLHIRFITHYKDLAKVTMMEHTHFNEEFRKWILERRTQRIGAIEQIISEGIASGEFRQVNPKAAALVFTGTLNAVCSPIIFSPAGIEAKKLLEPALDVVFHGLSKE